MYQISRQVSRVGAVTALVGSIVALLAFFAFPLFSVPFLDWGLSAFDLASHAGKTYPNTILNVSNDLSLLWLAPLLSVVIAILSIIAIRSPLQQDITLPPPQPYNQSNPHTFYGSTTLPFSSLRQSTTGRSVALGIITCSILSLILTVIFYIRISTPINSNLTLSLASFLAIGFWLYIVGIVIALIGGCIQRNA